MHAWANLASRYPLFVQPQHNGPFVPFGEWLAGNADVMGGSYTPASVFNPDNADYCENIEYMDKLNLSVQHTDGNMWRIEQFDGDIWAINPRAMWCEASDSYVMEGGCGMKTLHDIETRIADIYSMARICKWSSVRIGEELKARIYEPLNARYPSGKRKHTQYEAGYAAGVIARYRSEIWEKDVEFCYLVDGILYSTHKQSNRPTTEVFYKAGNGNVLADSPNAHYWKLEPVNGVIDLDRRDIY